MRQQPAALNYHNDSAFPPWHATNGHRGPAPATKSSRKSRSSRLGEAAPDRARRLPVTIQTQMKVLKFGGSSLGSPARVRDVGRIVLDAHRREPVVVVVSAFQGVTNQLVECARLAERGDAGVRGHPERPRETAPDGGRPPGAAAPRAGGGSRRGAAGGAARHHARHPSAAALSAAGARHRRELRRAAVRGHRGRASQPVASGGVRGLPAVRDRPTTSSPTRRSTSPGPTARSAPTSRSGARRPSTRERPFPS